MYYSNKNWIFSAGAYLRVCFAFLRVTLVALVVEINSDLICCCFLLMLFNTFVNGKSFVVIIVWIEFVLKKQRKNKLKFNQKRYAMTCRHVDSRSRNNYYSWHTRPRTVHSGRKRTYVCMVEIIN